MGYLLLLEIGLVASHIAANKHHFTNIFFSFTMTFILKKLMKSMNEKEKAGIIGLAGYSIMLSHIILYLADVIRSSKTSTLPMDEFDKYMDKYIDSKIKMENRLNAFDLDKNFKQIEKFKMR